MTSDGLASVGTAQTQMANHGTCPSICRGAGGKRPHQIVSSGAMSTVKYGQFGDRNPITFHVCNRIRKRNAPNESSFRTDEYSGSAPRRDGGI